MQTETFTSRAAALGEFVEVVRELGGDPEQLLDEEGLSIRDLNDPENSIPALSVGQLIINGAEHTGHPHFGATLATRRDMQSYFGALGRLVWAAPDLGTSMKEFSRYISLHIEGSQWTLDVDDELARLTNSVPAQSPHPQLVEHNLILVRRLFGAISHNRWTPYFACFSTPRPKDTQFLRRVLGCPLRFNAEFNGIEFHSSDLFLKLPSSDKQLGAILHSYVDPVYGRQDTNLPEQVTELIQKNLLSGRFSIDSVSRFFPHSRSTLQKRLSEQGTSYQKLLNSVRDQKAADMLLNTDISIGELSDLLGYRTIDAFSRAFKNRLGEAPSQWRHRRRSGDRSGLPSE